MKIKLDKSKFTSMENGFLILKEHVGSDAGKKILKDVLKYTFPECDFDIQIIPTEFRKNDEIFVMSVYPEVGVMEKIIDAILANKEIDSIKKLWESNKKWTIEIDGKILDSSVIELSERELTAILLHEVGHIIASSSIVNRLSIILRYELTKASVQSKMILRDRTFSTIMSLPILDACVADGKRDKTSIKEEIKADAFVKKMGYSDDLLSVLTKISEIQRKTNGYSLNSKISKSANFSLELVNDLQKRRDVLMKNKLLTLKESCESPYINSILDTYIERVFNDSEDSLTIHSGRKVEYMLERVEKLTDDEYMTEFFMFGQKELKRIEPAELDYIQVRINDIKNENDRMMVISYIHSKLDLVEYYISVLEHPKLSKKYFIPHKLEDLLAKKKYLSSLREAALNAKIPERNKGIIVQYPTGYEG